MEALQVIDALLDVLDATGTVIGLMTLWYTWVVPPRVAPEPVMAMDVEHFLQAVGTAVPARSAGPPQKASNIRAPSEWAGTAADRA
jgi:hypothetical protein